MTFSLPAAEAIPSVLGIFKDDAEEDVFVIWLSGVVLDCTNISASGVLVI